MIEIEINNAKPLIDTLQQIAERADGRKRAGLMRRLAGSMESAVLTNFDEGGRPKWLGLKYRKGKPLVDTENLMGSINSHYDKASAAVGTNEVYAPLHHFGGKAGRGRKVEIPARPFLTLTEQDEGDLLANVQDYFQRLLD